MMELPPFPISPLDDGKPLHRVPRAIARIEIDGQNWILRPCNELLFARREEQNSNDWTWIAIEPTPKVLPSPFLEAIRQRWKKMSPPPYRPDFPTSADGLSALWRKAVKKNWVARFALCDNPRMECVFPYFFHHNGLGFVREFWNRDEFPFDWQNWQTQAKEDVWICPVSHFLELAALHAQPLFETLNDTWNANNEWMHFIRGSEEELVHLSRLICWNEPLFMSFASDIEVGFSSDNGFKRARLSMLGTQTDYWHRMDAPTDKTIEWWYAGWDTPAPPEHLQRLFELALDQNTPASLYWQHHGQREYHGRAAVRDYWLTAQFFVPPPSQHERLEARLELRDWLQTRVSIEEAERLLRA